ncbi:protein bni4 p53858 [Diplodia corticola]|uniref:Protein bni4 p53858 n=1 Tax=Diplodia corticola TaxID=236234 RepID=A0A1J9QQ43_9PEZI|nr:protein bni4 p53858 [Diplodia corticola]OJD30146.1 protein bni4 p53858 [Diplodia corticola]
MAEVLAPVTQPNSSIAMLHSSSSGDAQSHHQSSSSRSSNMPRTQYYNTPGGGIGYRGSSATPVQAYAFQQTPQLRQENRSTSAPVNPYSQAQAFSTTLAPTKQGHATHPSSSSGSTASSSSSNQSSTRQRSGSKDDSALSHPRTKSASSSVDSSRQLSAINLSTSVPDLTLTSFDTPAKTSPDRYRRSRNTSGPSSPSLPQDSKSAAPSGSGMAGVAHLYKNNAPNPRPGHNRTSSMDDSVLPRANSEQAKRYRRRSLNNFEGVTIQQGTPTWAPQQRQDARLGAHKNNSGESISSGSNSTRPSSSKRDNAQTSAGPPSPKGGQQSRSPNVPARGSSTDATKRVANPSPLSKTASGAEAPPGSSGRGSAADAVAGAKSPAAQHLTALNEKEKGVKSRLRRAFSFGSAAELRKASVENASSARMHQRVQQQEEIDPEDAAIAAKQEAAGIGNSIYSGQGGVFSSSTDNLSIQSTASSASVMLRKMGKGMKKGGRSLKGLFRPKSVIGVPAADSAVQASVGQVSMVNVEAEREKVNVNVSPADQAGGGTGFPKLERNSLEVSSVSERPSSVGGAGADGSRKSIMGGERERAEVLAAVRKGILKRTGTDSPSPQVRPADGAPGFTHNHDTPNSSAPSTPGDDNRPNLALGGDDYFVGASRFAAGSSRSLPTTPHGGPRNISFSPRIQFHDAFSSSEYDRRGDIATCNRLTPLLAQQIKEEINTFKMEMEVHEMSKPHTHFF